MARKKRWQLVLITLVILLTCYNILPTILFYTQPLKQPIDEKRAESIAQSTIKRVNELENNSIQWLRSYNKLLNIKDSTIVLDNDNPQIIHVSYQKHQDAETLRKHLPTAGSLIPFIPAQLSLIDQGKDQPPNTVSIQRNIPIHFDANKIKTYFKFTPKAESDGSIAPLYKEVIIDRLIQLGLSVGGISENAQFLEAILHLKNNPKNEEFLQILSHNILTYSKVFGESSPIAKRYYSSITQGPIDNKRNAINTLIHTFENYNNHLKLEKISLQEAEEKKKAIGSYLDTQDQQNLDSIRSQEKKISSTIAILKRQIDSFSNGENPWVYSQLKQDISLTKQDSNGIQIIDVGHHSPLISNIQVDWKNDKINLYLHEDIKTYKKTIAQTKSYLTDPLDQIIYNEIARINRETGEYLFPKDKIYSINLNNLTNSQSMLVMDLSSIAEKQAQQLVHLIKTQWFPTHHDLKRSAFKIYDYKTFQKLSPMDQKIGLVIYAPAQFENQHPNGFKVNSVYVILKGIQEIQNKLNDNPNSPQAKAFHHDLQQLNALLRNNGFYGYPGTTYPLSSTFAKDFIFEAEDYYNNILSATREDFTVHGTRKYATLDFTDVEQRILALNKIETKEHEDLLKWRDEYQANLVNLNSATKFNIPAPTKNLLFSNLSLSAKKYFRGDERKILHWGLDLSGGKTVQIQLRDKGNKIVTNDEDIKQGMNELYNRVNKMGVSEVHIRQEGSNIALDFPSAQGLSATDLVKASSMYFHIVNEKFNSTNQSPKPTVNKFLQDVWNEAVVTNRKDIESINQIAWKHLYGNTLDTNIAQPISEVAKTLYDQGLRLPHPNETEISSTFNDSLSKIAILRGENYSDWFGQSTPLLIVMNNYALEGSNLTDVHAKYDPSKGNFLSFHIKGSQTMSNGQKINPRSELYNWTSTFSKDNIQGSSLEKMTNGDGWRMAVILNGSVISAPNTTEALRDNVSIFGNFSQREVNQLEADLKAGSLSFAPHILSEKNVSPELGIKDRIMGVIATIVALTLVILVMIGYYRFAGIIASVAVIINLLIIWATLQNISATVTLAGIAGIILTLGMAVDANVLVFERIREEFSASGRIAQAVQIGYKKAFSAIFDSNITTLIAALILLHFDSGPIKGFAVTLIIGIVSSMFTALFMTRYFFTGWVMNPKNKVLKMANIIRKSHFNFLKYSKVSLYAIIAVILLGGYLLVMQHSSMLGMDFTGGYSASIELKQKDNFYYRNNVESALIAAGATPQDIQVRELTPSNHLKILLGKSLDQIGKPFNNMPIATESQTTTYEYQNNPRLVWLVNALEAQNMQLTPQSLQSLDSNWTSISGQMSNTMRNNAIIGLSIALICIFAYITVRFEFKYAMSATIGLTIDVTVTGAIISLLHFVGAPIQIDLNTIAAIMTIIGYSLNDTIIIFDRIREDLKHMRKYSFKDIINNALNVTLSRTIMTSSTTLVVLLALLILGGNAIFGLSVVMIIGVVFGTFSSLFVAAPLLLFFHKQEKAKEKKLSLNEN